MSDEPNLRSFTVGIVTSTTSCWCCKADSPVVGLLLANSQEFYEGAWHDADEVFVHYLTKVPPTVEALLDDASAGRWRMDYSKTMGMDYYMNHCESCDAKIGDNGLSRFDGAFFPMTRAGADAIDIRWHENTPFVGAGEMVYFAPTLTELIELLREDATDAQHDLLPNPEEPPVTKPRNVFASATQPQQPPQNGSEVATPPVPGGVAMTVSPSPDDAPQEPPVEAGDERPAPPLPRSLTDAELKVLAGQSSVLSMSHDDEVDAGDDPEAAAARARRKAQEDWFRQIYPNSALGLEHFRKLLDAGVISSVGTEKGAHYFVLNDPENRSAAGSGIVVDRGSCVDAIRGTDIEIQMMVEVALARGWKSVKLDGDQDFKARAASAFALAGIRVRGWDAHAPADATTAAPAGKPRGPGM